MQVSGSIFEAYMKYTKCKWFGKVSHPYRQGWEGFGLLSHSMWWLKAVLVDADSDNPIRAFVGMWTEMTFCPTYVFLKYGKKT